MNQRALRAPAAAIVNEETAKTTRRLFNGAREPLEKRLLWRRQLLLDLGMLFRERLGIRQILEALGFAPCRVGRGPEPFLDERKRTRDTHLAALEGLAVGGLDEGRKCGVVAELHRSFTGSNPVLGVRMPREHPESDRFERGSQNAFVAPDRDVDVESRPGLAA
jgi:hypothetical protein